MSKRNTIITILIAIGAASVLLSPVAMAAQCGGAETAIISCSGSEGQGAVFELIKTVIKIMTAGVFVLAVGAVVAGAIIYITSEGSPDKLAKAKTIWINTVIGMLMFMFLVALTNFLIPGGVF